MRFTLTSHLQPVQFLFKLTANQLHSPHGFYLISKLFVQHIQSDYGQHGE